MSKRRESTNPNQYTFTFEQATLPAPPETAATTLAELPTPTEPTEPHAEPPAAAQAAPEGNPSADDHGDVPVPKPLAAAVRRGVFGTDEDGEPVDPSPEEVLAITLHHGERLTSLLGQARGVAQRLAAQPTGGRGELLREQDRVRSSIHSVVGLYAEDFGDTAARHFESWAAQQLGTDPVGPASPPTGPKPSGGRGVERPTEPVRPTVPAATPTAAPDAGPDPKPERGRAGKPKARAADAATPEAKAEKIGKLHESVDQALDRLAESLAAGRSDTLQAWLKTMGRFHDYSMNNQMLIAWQRPDATRVAGFHAWKKFDRLVTKGEKGIMILAPVTRPVAKVEEKDDQGNTKERTLRRIVNTKVVYVFDVSQTHGEPLPELAQVSGDPAEHTGKVKDLIKARNVELYYADRLPRGAQGLSEGGRIGCVNGLPPAEEFRTLVHELAHELLHRGERRQATTKRSRELEAESVAFVVCSAVGLDARQSSTDYIHLFRGDKQMLVESLQFIRQVSNDILSVLLPAKTPDPARE